MLDPAAGGTRVSEDEPLAAPAGVRGGVVDGPPSRGGATGCAWRNHVCDDRPGELTARLHPGHSERPPPCGQQDPVMLDELVRVALDAGAAILEVYGRDDFQARAKDDGFPVTEADARAEAIIVDALARIAPGVPVVAEEAVSQGVIPATKDRFFLVDPLDGTKEFLNRNGDFTVNIALVEHGRPVLGVVYAPAHGEIYAGGEGMGARMAAVKDGSLSAWRPIVVRDVPEAGLDVVASRSHLSDETRAFVGRFKVAEFVSAGSSLKFCRVAAGQADLYPRLGRTMEWDTAAGDAVLRAAGGSVRTLAGRPLAYGKRKQATDSDFANPWFVACGRFDPFAAASVEA